MSMTFSSDLTLPCWAKRVSSEGLGAAATSGGLPAATRVVRIASWSRVASNWTVIPVWSVNGLSTALKDSNSLPDHTPRTVTLPPCTVVLLLLLLLAPGAQAAPASAVMTARYKPRRRLNTRIAYPQQMSCYCPLCRSYNYLLS